MGSFSFCPFPMLVLFLVQVCNLTLDNNLTLLFFLFFFLWESINKVNNCVKCSLSLLTFILKSIACSHVLKPSNPHHPKQIQSAHNYILDTFGNQIFKEKKIISLEALEDPSLMKQNFWKFWLVSPTHPSPNPIGFEKSSALMILVWLQILTPIHNNIHRYFWNLA